MMSAGGIIDRCFISLSEFPLLLILEVTFTTLQFVDVFL